MPFLKRLPDDISPEEIRAFRAGRGWTPEQLADVVGGTLPEVLAWEAGVVRVPIDQAHLIDRLMAADRWYAHVVEAGLPACPWVESERPDYHERLIAFLGRTRREDDDELRAHARACPACKQVRRFALQMPYFPAVQVLTEDAMLRTRFGRLVVRLPSDLGMLLFLCVSLGPAVALLFVFFPREPSATVELNMALLFAASSTGIAYQITEGRLKSRLLRYRSVAAALVGMVIGTAGAVAFDLMSDAVAAANPGLWAGGAVLGVLAGGLAWFRDQRAAKDAEPEIVGEPAGAASLPGQTVPAFEIRESPAPAAVAVPRGAHGLGELA